MCVSECHKKRGARNTSLSIFIAFEQESMTGGRGWFVLAYIEGLNVILGNVI